MLFLIYSDLHLFAPHALDELVLRYEAGSVFLGDTFDLKNTPKKEITQARKEQLEHDELCKSLNIVNVAGNHDLLPLDFVKNVVVGSVLFTHGHLICWDESKVAEWELKEPKGIGKVKYALLKLKHSFGRGKWKPNKEEKERAYKLATDYNCKTIVFGHTHTSEIIDIEYMGIRIINVPRGLTKLEL